MSFLYPSPDAVERLRELILKESGIELNPVEALRFGTFLLQATVLLAEPRPNGGKPDSGKDFHGANMPVAEPGAPLPSTPRNGCDVKFRDSSASL